MMGIAAENGKWSVRNGIIDLRGAQAGIVFPRWKSSLSSDWTFVSQEEFDAQDACGAYHGLRMTYDTPERLRVTWEGAVYGGGMLACRMQVRNCGGEDIRMAALLPLHVSGRSGGSLRAAGLEPQRCVLLRNARWMGGVRELTAPLDPRRPVESYHVSALIDRETNAGLAIGMGERTNTIVRVQCTPERTGFGLTVSGLLDTDLHAAPLRLRPGACFAMNRVVLLGGANVFDTLEEYGAALAAFAGIKAAPRPASGIFCVYGQDRTDSDDWEKTALTDARVGELLDVADRYLRPFGAVDIKTQFGGASSGPSKANGLNIGARREWTAQPVWPRPLPGETLAQRISREGFTPDTCDISRYHPQGVAAMCAAIHARGYRNALVCRPYLNVMAGSDERDAQCAEIFRMAVEQWGYDYLMFDFIDADFETDSDETTIAESISRRFAAVRRAVGPQVYIEACMVMPGCVLGLADSYRAAGDWRGGTEEELAGLLTPLYFLHGKVFSLDSEFFDPDLTPFVWANERHDRLRFFGSLERIKSWVSFCALVGYNSFTGGVIDDVSPERWAIFSRMLPPHGRSAVPLDLARAQTPAVWRLQGTHGGCAYCAVGYFNWDSLRQKQAAVSYREIGLDPQKRYVALSFWEGRVYELEDGLSLPLPPSACAVLLIHEIADAPVYLGSDRHVTGLEGVAGFEYAPREGCLRGCSQAPAGETVTHYVFMPDNRGPARTEGCAAEVSQPGVLRVTTRTGADGRQAWRVWLADGLITI